MNNHRNKVWILTFEYKGIAKVGGLGEVPANQAVNLKDKYDFRVFIPSHGQLARIQGDHEVNKIPIECAGELQLKGNDESEIIEGLYEIGFYQFNLNGIDIILLKGENEFTSRYLDDRSVYNPDTFETKLALYSMGMRCYLQILIDKNTDKLPEIIHLHDYHAVIPFISIKQELFKNDIDIPSVITIHLLTWPRYPLDFIRSCGIDNTPIKIRCKDGLRSMDIEEIFELCQKTQSKKPEKPPTLEKIGAIISDLVLSVSESYLKSDIIPNLGKELIEFKSDFVWNGCDWDYYDMRSKVLDKLGKDIMEYIDLTHEKEITREQMKKFLLIHKIGNLDQSPLINSEKILATINQISNGNPFVKNGRIKAFENSGPLALMTGRLSKQKGFGLILKSIPDIIKKIPNAKFLFLILPTEYSIDEIKEYAKYVKEYPENLRIIFGVAADIFDLAHLSADVYCAVSRWEPFGIIALEAMASKLPIIATKVGGLQETVIDIRNNPDKGTGLLIDKDEESQLIKAIVDMLQLSIINRESREKDRSYLNDIEIITDESIKEIVKNDPEVYSKIKKNCYLRVEENFRWEQVVQKLGNLYEKIKRIYKNQ
ncbi:MAG: GDP-mannose-dependent alpha-(1-6)-phosphatidylinositol monomannoside mannosyltransferase [Promethearchaeota archaeon]|nr:MAG: GDP-mannose-dependent alpha-(1-6)-phosphatidylinositol monomannoside mannosyltransferase [Candidatus Lokiarchaeota archaeon]